MTDSVIKPIEFSKLRAAYVTVKEFIRAESLDGEDISLKTKIDEDLGLSGDDNAELLDKFIKRFSLDASKFKYEDHFHSEGELFGSTAALFNLVGLLVWVPQKLIQLVSFGRFQAPPFKADEPVRKVRDLSFRDMLVWYIEGTYGSETNVKYKLA